MNRQYLIFGGIGLVLIGLIFLCLQLTNPRSALNETQDNEVAPMSQLNPPDEINSTNMVSLPNNDPAFSSTTYYEVSPLPLSKSEKTVTYTYPEDSCGTLMSQFTIPGSVYAGRGPVYALAARQCSETASDAVPNDNSFRVQACQNLPSSGADNAYPVAEATFAFTCLTTASE